MDDERIDRWGNKDRLEDRLPHIGCWHEIGKANDRTVVDAWITRLQQTHPTHEYRREKSLGYHRLHARQR